MKQYFYLYSLVLILILTSACKSARKAYDRGDYESAMFMALDKLKSSPGNKKATETVQIAYPAMLSYYLERINRSKQSSDPLKWDHVLMDYTSLNKVYDELQRTPAARNLLPEAKYFLKEYNEALDQTLETRYILGEEALSSNTREGAMNAYDHFMRVAELRSNYKDVNEKIEMSREAATINVEVSGIVVHSKRYKLSSDFFMSQMKAFLQQEPISPFVRFVTPESGRVNTYRIDHTLALSFEDFLVGQSHTREIQADRIKDSVVLEVTEVKDTTISIYGTVEARLFGFEKEILSSGILKVTITDQLDGQVLLDKELTGTFTWYDYWGYYQGDKRALDEEDIKYLDRRRPIREPDPQTMFIEFTRPIYDQATRELTRFYEVY